MIISEELDKSLQRAYDQAKSRHHEFITLEHILLEFLQDPVCRDILLGCGVNLDQLKDWLEDFLDNDMPKVDDEYSPEPQYSLGSQFVLRIAAMHVQSAGKEELTSGNVLIAMFRE